MAKEAGVGYHSLGKISLFNIGHGDVSGVWATAESCLIAANSLLLALALLRLNASISGPYPHLVPLAPFPSDVAGEVHCA
jgi:hypothetical protein